MVLAFETVSDPFFGKVMNILSQGAFCLTIILFLACCLLSRRGAVIIISQFILHSTLAFHNKEPAIESFIVFLLELMHIRSVSVRRPFRGDSLEYRVHRIESRYSTRYSIVNTREYRVSSVTLHLGGTVYCIFLTFVTAFWIQLDSVCFTMIAPSFDIQGYSFTHFVQNEPIILKGAQPKVMDI